MADCAIIVIWYFVRAGLSADDRRIAVPESAFEAFSGSRNAVSDGLAGVSGMTTAFKGSILFDRDG
ncbi:hypothetical protein [Undibacterium squillarum]|uniref:hypothetical protein n=1 Tax=Undibacterium squillarum TaxID=1131567 RepID=UPI0035B1DD6A